MIKMMLQANESEVDMMTITKLTKILSRRQRNRLFYCHVFCSTCEDFFIVVDGYHMD